MTSITLRTPRRSPSEAPSHTSATFLSSPWMWAVVACLLLGISGGIRLWREHQFASLAAESDSPPFSLKELPRILDNWRSEEGMDDHLDPRVALVAGSSDHTVRTYLNEKSGDQMTVLTLYGLAEKVWGHMPDVCYPAAGYQLVEGPEDREMTVPGLKAPVRYRWAIYMKRVGGIGSYHETYHTFYYNRAVDAGRLESMEVVPFSPRHVQDPALAPDLGLEQRGSWPERIATQCARPGDQQPSVPPNDRRGGQGNTGLGIAGAPLSGSARNRARLIDPDHREGSVDRPCRAICQPRTPARRSQRRLLSQPGSDERVLGPTRVRGQLSGP